MRRRAQAEADRLAFLLAGDDLGHAIDMARDDVAAQFVADLERPLEIEPCPLNPCVGRGQAERFFPGLDLEPAGVRANVWQGDDRQARAGTGDGGTDLDRGRIVGGFDAEPLALRQRLDPGDPADIGDDPREHQSLTHSQYRSRP